MTIKLLVILKICLYVVVYTDIHVSNKGSDTLSCGQKSYPCKTIPYAINKSSEQSVVILEGGIMNQMKYELRDTLYLHKSISIRKNNNSYFNPEIYRSPKDCKEVNCSTFIRKASDVFQLTRSNDIYLSLYGIEFNFDMRRSDVTILRLLNIDVKESNISVGIDINNCSFRHAKEVFTISNTRNSAININVRNSSFFYIGSLLNVRHSRKVAAHFDQCTFTDIPQSRSYFIFMKPEIKNSNLFNVLNFKHCQFNLNHSISVNNTYITIKKSVISSSAMLEAINCTIFISNSIFKKWDRIAKKDAFYQQQSGLKQNFIAFIKSRGKIVSTNISNNRFPSFERILYIDESHILISSSIFHNNKSPHSVLHIDQSKVNISDTDISYNSARNIFYTDKSTISINNSRFVKNSAGSSGGALYSRLSSVNISNTIFSDNKAKYYAGGIYMTGSKFIINNSSFVRNSADSLGGALYSYASSVNISNTAISYNNAKSDAGGIYMDRSIFIIHNSSFIGNRARGTGGALYSSASSVNISNTAFSDNVARNAGGIYMDKSKFIINNSSFVRNSAGFGGALYSFTSSVNISNTAISYNNAKSDAGGIQITGSKFIINNSSFVRNSARVSGGALYIDTNFVERSRVTLVNTKIRSNIAGRDGGAIKTRYSQLYIFFSIIEENFGNRVGGTVCESSSVTMLNVTFRKNFSLQSPSALLYNVSPRRHRLLFKMDNITVKTVARKNQQVPDALWVTSTSLPPVNLQVEINNVNVTLSRTKETVPSIRLTLPERTNLSMHYTCPVNYDASYSSFKMIDGYWQVYMSCKFCARGTYRLETFSQIVQIPPVNRSKASNRPVQCFPCPVGGNCESYIKSNDRFWGYVMEGLPIFLPCPEEYCCSQKSVKCESIQSCAKHRTGKLCGICKKGHQISYSDNRCLSTTKCTRPILFWTVFVIFGITYAMLLAYLKEISFFSKYFCFQLLRKFSELRNVSKKVEEIRLNELNITQDSSNFRHEYTLINEDDFVVIHGSPPTKEVMASNHKYHKENSRISGMLKVLVAFYQIKGLIHIEVDLKTDKVLNVLDRLGLEIFNLKIPTFFKFCPKKKLTVVERMIIKEFLFVHCMLLSALVFLLIAGLFYVMRRNRLYYWRYRRFLLRASICCLHVIILAYTIWAKFSLQFINCRKVDGEYILYVNGEITCYTLWQRINIAFFVLWILPFPLTLSISVRLLENHKITTIRFFCCVLFPPLTFAYLILEKFHRRRYITSDTILKKYISNMFQEPFRLYKDGKKCLFWDAWRLYERLTIAVFSIFFIDPLKRLCFTLPVMLLLLVVHLRVKPYKSKFINWMETASLVSLCFLVGVNQFRAFLYMYSYENQENIIFIATVLNVMEFLSTPVCGFFLFLVWKLCKKIFCKLNRCV